MPDEPDRVRSWEDRAYTYAAVLIVIGVAALVVAILGANEDVGILGAILVAAGAAITVAKVMYDSQN